MKSLVLLDDNFAIRQLVGMLLAELGNELGSDFQLYASENGVEGLGYIYITSPDLIVIDTTLPKYSGREVLEFLTTNKRFHDSETKVIVLEESSNDHVYPQNFYVIHKHDPHFLEELLTTIGQSQKSGYRYRPSLFRTLAKFIIHLSNKNDRLAHKNQLQNYWSEPLSYIPWLLRELIVSFVIAFVFLVKNQVANQSIEQTHTDLKSYRVKYYPTMVIGASALLVVAFQAGSLLLPQVLLLQQAIAPAAAATATFVVNSNADDVDFNPGDGFCDTSGGIGVGPCTLRAAIEEANATAGADTINFAIGSGFVDIVTKDLPAIAESLVLDASTQPTASCDPLTPMIGLSNTNDGDDVGLEVSAGDVTIRGFVINGYETGLNLTADDTLVEVQCNIIGLAGNGFDIVGNTTGIYTSGTSTFAIGGANASQRNLISGNFTGLSLDYGTHIVQGNYIGVGVDGVTQAGNSTTGIAIGADNVVIGGATGTTPGGSCTGACNLISNNGYGINSFGSNGLFVGNYIGTDVDGTQDYGNLQVGIKIDYGQNNIIGGNSANERNLISGNDNQNIQLRAAGLNSIIGNYIGVDTTGTVQLGSSPVGIEIVSIGATGSNENIIGTTNVGEANIISAVTGVSISGTNTNTNLITGNYIGTDFGKVTGFAHDTSIYIANDSNNDVIAHNVIANFTSAGISPGTATVMHDNEIFYGMAGISLSGATNADIYSNNIHDTDYGIVLSAGANLNSFRSNFFSASSLAPIDILGDGVTPNDAGDIDAGENELQNFPVLTSATTYAYNTNTDIVYQLDTEAGNYLVEFFSTTEIHPSNHGEVTGLLCSDLITHAGSGLEAFAVTCPTQAPAGSRVTAIATEDLGAGDFGNSSELAENVEVDLVGTDGIVAITEPVHVGSNILISITDLDLNTSASSSQTVSAEVLNNTTAEVETVTLTEQNNNSAVFTGSLPSTYSLVVGSNNSSILNVKAGDTITFSYLDALGVVYVNQIVSDSAVMANGLPIANTDIFSAVAGTSLVITPIANDLDPEGAFNTSSLSIVSAPLHGVATVNLINSTIIYTPNTGYAGADAFTYTICDTTAQCATGLVSIAVSIYSPTPLPSLSITPSPTSTPSLEPTAVGLEPTTEVSTTSTPQVSATPVIDILPETGGKKNLLSSLFDSAVMGETLVHTVVVLPLIVAVAANAYSYPGLTLYAFAWLRRHKRHAPWGIVYDSGDLSPVAFARVSLYDHGKIVQERMTDLEGRYNFVVDKGQYELRIHHPHYPEVKQEIKIAQNEQALSLDLALARQDTKSKAVSLRYYLKRNLRSLSMVIFAIGLVFSTLAATLTPTAFNQIVLVVYLLQILVAAILMSQSNKRRSWGYVYDAATRSRVRGAFLRLYTSGEGNQIDVQMTDAAGRFGFLVAPGHYLLSADHPAYTIPSPKQNMDRFFVSSNGKVLTNLTVKQNTAINIAISAERRSGDATTSLPTPFGS